MISLKDWEIEDFDLRDRILAKLGEKSNYIRKRWNFENDSFFTNNATIKLRTFSETSLGKVATERERQQYLFWQMSIIEFVDKQSEITSIEIIDHIKQVFARDLLTYGPEEIKQIHSSDIIKQFLQKKEDVSSFEKHGVLAEALVDSMFIYGANHKFVKTQNGKVPTCFPIDEKVFSLCADISNYLSEKEEFSVVPYKSIIWCGFAGAWSATSDDGFLGKSYGLYSEDYFKDISENYDVKHLDAEISKLLAEKANIDPLSLIREFEFFAKSMMKTIDCMEDNESKQQQYMECMKAMFVYGTRYRFRGEGDIQIRF